MARRYSQTCPIAHSLDLLGTRWTLLIVRDLLLGPLRFSDLLARLPGIGRNLLTSRLAEMQEQGLLEHNKLPPPASSWVYELTTAGEELAAPLAALARWGSKHAPRPPAEDDHHEDDLMALALALAADREAGAGLNEEHEFVVSGTPFHIAWQHGRPRPRRGRAHAPHVTLELEADRLARALKVHDLAPDQAVAKGELAISGDTGTATEVAALYGLTGVIHG